MVLKSKKLDYKKASKKLFYKAKAILSRREPVSPRPSQIINGDLLYSLVQLTAQKRAISNEQASYHPFVNFLIKKRQACNADEQKTLIKIVANFESFLLQTEDSEIIKTFYQYFASPQGLILFRCAMLTIRYFSRSIIKLTAHKPHFMLVFFALSQSELLNCKNNTCDQVVQQILTDEELPKMSHSEIRSWIVQLTK
ncbi:MAG: hypothetical protein A3E87_08630 [Gammaproteobacteria bacterium RIFCSPHIGHO2_12_FULL_35_23]|nr:MAG: hypothetical protein A3E87_08630 [Gammaproteobacteria bacterium RIFCSPHIGHO2_12_FULL_35_23]